MTMVAMMTMIIMTMQVLPEEVLLMMISGTKTDCNSDDQDGSDADSDTVDFVPVGHLSRSQAPY